MKLLIVAHPDDEVIWFNPKEFDQIVIVFSNRIDRSWIHQARVNAISEHPYRKKISFIQLQESGYWRDKKMFQCHQENYFALEEILEEFCNTMKYSKVYTHNANGEYGHADHILVHDIVKRVFYYKRSIPVWTLAEQTQNPNQNHKNTKTDVNDFKKIKGIYTKHNAWTWNDSYMPPNYRNYQLIE